jgi:NTP pyrophosphatase (non-canonical NTP hydrolase)/archaellum component FlaC
MNESTPIDTSAEMLQTIDQLTAENAELRATCKHWVDQNLIEVEKRGVCEHELSQARGNLAESFEKLERECDDLRAELERVKADRNRQGMLARTEAFKMCDDLRAKLDLRGAEMNTPTWPYVRGFASLMEHKLNMNRHKGDREGWIKDDPWSLVERLLDETVEVQQCFTIGSDGRVDFKDAEELANECADVANFAMMIADAAGGLKPHTQCGVGWLNPEKAAKLQRDLDTTAANYFRELAAVDKAKDIIQAEQEKVNRLREALKDIISSVNADLERRNVIPSHLINSRDKAQQAVALAETEDIKS